MFIIQMMQVPLIIIGRMPVFRKRFWLGNLFFWLCMLFGPPFLGILYCREAFWATWSTNTPRIPSSI
jgi:sterol O-acyltransferase